MKSRLLLILFVLCGLGVIGCAPAESETPKPKTKGKPIPVEGRPMGNRSMQAQ
ncbi:MAG: hypothetical protein IT205_01175 [Fimbriimonadaceae bacterium]|nr:hypothetical protein [Fimbriimonadaceae bacterium]